MQFQAAARNDRGTLLAELFAQPGGEGGIQGLQGVVDAGVRGGPSHTKPPSSNARTNERPMSW